MTEANFGLSVALLTSSKCRSGRRPPRRHRAQSAWRCCCHGCRADWRKRSDIAASSTNSSHDRPNLSSSGSAVYDSSEVAFVRIASISLMIRLSFCQATPTTPLPLVQRMPDRALLLNKRKLPERRRCRANGNLATSRCALLLPSTAATGIVRRCRRPPLGKHLQAPGFAAPARPEDDGDLGNDQQNRSSNLYRREDVAEDHAFALGKSVECAGRVLWSPLPAQAR